MAARSTRRDHPAGVDRYGSRAWSTVNVEIDHSAYYVIVTRFARARRQRAAVDERDDRQSASGGGRIAFFYTVSLAYACR